MKNANVREKKSHGNNVRESPTGTTLSKFTLQHEYVEYRLKNIIFPYIVQPVHQKSDKNVI